MKYETYGLGCIARLPGIRYFNKKGAFGISARTAAGLIITFDCLIDKLLQLKKNNVLILRKENLP